MNRKSFLKNRKFRIIALATLILFLGGMVYTSFGLRKEVKADSYFKFDEGYGTSSAIHDTNNAVSAGSITNASWKTEDLCFDGKCLYFDGSGDYVSLGDNFDFTQAADFTIEFWFRTGDISSNTHVIVGKYRGDDVGGEGGYKIYLTSDGKVNFGVDDDITWGPDDVATSANAYDDNRWHHVAAVKSDTAKISLYIDSLLVAEDPNISATGSLENDDNFTLGMDSDGSSNSYTGFIDELKVYNSGARTPSEIKGDYTGNNFGAATSPNPVDTWLTKNLLGYWKLDESSGNASDSSGNSYTLTNNSSMVYTVGKFGNGVQCDGSFDYLNTTTTISSIQSVSLWVYPAAAANNYFINLTNNSAYITINSSGVVSATGFTSPSIYVNGVINKAVSATTWNLITVTTNTGVSASNFSVGQTYDTSAHYCTSTSKIDNVLIYSRALSQDEVSQLYDWGPGPIGWWKMDENTGTNTYDSSGYGNNGTLTNSPTWTTGKLGSGLNFRPNTINYVTAVDSTSLSLTGNGSYSAWVYSNRAYPSDSATTYYRFILAKYGGGSCTSARDGYWFQWYGNSTPGNGQITAGSCNGTTEDSLSYYTDLIPNTWYHFAFTWDGTNQNLYINGVRVDQEAQSQYPQESSTSLQIGSLDGSNVTYNWDGKIDDVRVYNYARTPDQIIEDMNGGHRAATSASFGPNQSWISNGLVGYWKMDEIATPSADFSGNGNNGTWYNGVASASGKFGNSVSFDGTDDYISTSDINSMDSASYLTISAWMKRLAASDPVLLQKRLGDSNRTNMGFHDDQYLYFTLANGDANSYAGVTTNNDTNWHHIVMVFDGTKTGNSERLKGYIDGVPQSLSFTSDIPSTTGSNSNNFEIGREGSTAKYTHGYTDEVRIYNRALSPDEVANLYNWAPGPIAHWKFDENGGAPMDSSGNNYNLTTSGTYQIEGVPGKNGSAAKVTTNHVSGGSQVGGYFNDITNFTFSFWVKIASHAEYDNYIPRFRVDGTHDISIQERGAATPGRLAFWIDNGGSSYGYADNLFSYGEWFHIGEVYDGNGSANADRLKVYINGQLVSLTFSGTIPDRVANLSTAYLYPAQLLTAGTEVAIDDFRVYNYSRTPTQIIEDMNAGHPAPGSPVGSSVAWWKFDEGYGDFAYNSGYSASASGDLGGAATTCPTAGSCPSWTNNGKFGKALDFDGTDDYVEVGTDTSVDNIFRDGGSVAAWFKIDGFGGGGFGRIIDKYASDTAIYVSAGGVNDQTNAVVLLRDGTAAGRWGTPVNSITTGVWYHIVVTFNENSMANDPVFYLNGQKVTTSETTTPSGTYVDDSPGNLHIGNMGNATSRAFNGIIDDLRIYQSELTADQVKVLYNQGAAVSWGVLSTASSSATMTSSARSYCPPGDTGTCNPPAGEWKFDENSGNLTYDTSTNANTGTLTSGPIWSTGKNGSSISYDCIDDYVTAGSDTSIDQIFGGGGTITAWIYPRSFGEGSLGRIADKGGSSTGTGWGLSVCNDGNSAHCNNRSLMLYYDSNAGTDGWFSSDANSITLNQWNHVVMIFNSSSTSNTPTFYVNGIKMTTTSNTAPTATFYDDSSNSLLFGNRTNQDRTFDGMIDEVKMYKYVRTPAQIAWDYNFGKPAAHWKMDEGTGDTANNSSEVAATVSGNLAGSGSCPGASACPTWTTSGKRNGALSFDGTDDYVETVNSSVLELTSTGSVATWIKWDSTSIDSPAIICKSNWTTDRNGYCLAGYTGGIDGELANGSSQLRISSINKNYRDNLWHHVVFTWDGTWMNLYVDGTSVAPRVSQTFNPISNIYSLTIGKNPAASSHYFKGLVDDVRIYNYALTAEQIKSVMNEGAALRFGPNEGSPQ